MGDPPFVRRAGASRVSKCAYQTYPPSSGIPLIGTRASRIGSTQKPLFCPDRIILQSA